MSSSRKPYTPRAYGSLMTNHILDVPRSAVWAGCGLGKTVCTATALAALNEISDDKTLVLAPLRVARDVWSDEVKKWDHLSGLNVMPIIGEETERRMALKYDAAIHTINYENLPWLIEYYGDRWPWRNVVADESTKLKGFRLRQGGKRAQALGKVAHTKVKRFVELTGTPASNGLVDLWGQAWFLDKGERLGRSFSAFQQRWFYSNPNGYGLMPREHAREEIQERLKDICLTIDARDWFDLKEPVVNNVVVDLPAKGRRLYKDMEDKFYMEIEGHGVEALNSASKSQKLLQLTNGAVYVDPLVETDADPRSRQWKEVHDIKLQALEEIVEESAGAPVIAVYQFRSDLARLKKAFPDGRNLSDAQELKEFKTGRYRIGFGHPASIGHGVDGLQQVCNIMVFFALDWNLENRLQIIERIGPVRQHQAGFDRPVFIHNIIARDTIDELVLARVDTKREVQDLLMEAMNRRRNRHGG